MYGGGERSRVCERAGDGNGDRNVAFAAAGARRDRPRAQLGRIAASDTTAICRSSSASTCATGSTRWRRARSTDTRIGSKATSRTSRSPGGKGGQFSLTAKGQGATLDYAERWPAISDIDADIRVEGTAADDRRGARAHRWRSSSAVRARKFPTWRTRVPCCDSTARRARRRASSWLHRRRARSPNGPDISATVCRRAVRRNSRSSSTCRSRVRRDTKVDARMRFADNQLRSAACRRSRRSTASSHSPKRARRQRRHRRALGGPAKLQHRRRDNRLQRERDRNHQHRNVARRRRRFRLPIA